MELPNPFPRTLLVGEEVARWDFDRGEKGWQADHQCEIQAQRGILSIRSFGNDPYLSTPAIAEGNEWILRMRIRARSGGKGQIFWSSVRHEGWSPDRFVTIPLQHDDQWHEHDIRLETEANLTGLRLDPGTAPGELQVDWIALYRGGRHPLELTAIEQSRGAVNLQLTNHGDQSIVAAVNGSDVTLTPAHDVKVAIPIAGSVSLQVLPIRVISPKLPTLQRTICVHRPDVPLDAITYRTGRIQIQAARDGSEVRIARDGQLIAALAPLVWDGESIAPLTLEDSDGPLRWRGDETFVCLELVGDDGLSVHISSERHLEGPVVRTYGNLEQGLLAGVEYLGRGEHSSSTLDIETAEHLRWHPDPMHVTMPLMATVTDRASVGITWDDSELQPVFASPIFWREPSVIAWH